jgi:hypothetical protein
MEAGRREDMQTYTDILVGIRLAGQTGRRKTDYN